MMKDWLDAEPPYPVDGDRHDARQWQDAHAVWLNHGPSVVRAAVRREAAYARLAADGHDIDREMYLLDPVYHAIVYRIHRGRPKPHDEAVWEDYSTKPPRLVHTGECVVDDQPWPHPCQRCGVPHAPDAESITIRDPDDEAVACGAFHLERMSGKHVWLAVHTSDGRSLAVNLYSRSRITMTMEEEG